tara:strand:- start:105 stop:566 length:462 start_codon:yes stop_codon:yes gene_type:complete
MGYYSDVGIVVAFDKRDDMEKVLTVYKMTPEVQRLDSLAEWSVYEGKDVCFAQYKNGYVKWYDGYDDVEAIRYLCTVAEQFGKEKGMSFAWKEVNVGEDGAIHENKNSLEDDDELHCFCDEWLNTEPATINFGCGDLMVIHDIKQLTEEKVDV